MPGIFVMAGHSCPKDGVLSHAYVPAIQVFEDCQALKTWMPATSAGMTGGMIVSGFRLRVFRTRPGMTTESLHRPSKFVISDIRMFCARNARVAVAQAAQVHYLERLQHPPE
jgi:hypothetical protein